MVDDDDIFTPVFTAPSGESLDEPLSSLLDQIAGLIDAQRVMAVSIVMVDADMNTAASRILCHPLVGPQLAKRLRVAAGEIDRVCSLKEAPPNNSSARVH